MKLVYGEILGTGSFATVRLARPRKKSSRFPPQVAVKSSSLTHAKMLLHEKAVLMELKHSPHIIRCFGHDHTKQKGEKVYNLFLEYAAGGTLADKLKNQPNKRFQESEIRRYTKSILEGVSCIHEKGYVHRDLKPENILICYSDCKETVKIADFGIAKRSEEEKKKKKKREVFRGTIFYLPPEALAKDEQEPPSDVWAVGCIVAEMFTGTSVWQCRQGEKMLDMAVRMASELPEIKTEELSPEGRDFLEKIFIKDPAKRWTAKMLLDHPFVADQVCEEAVTPRVRSPRSGPLDWIKKGSHHKSIAEKFRRLLMCQRRDWDASNHGISAA